ncbi:rhodanese-like domain-containing protein [Altererythrobacter arenosus]|uniref:Rhodanese-like domain-containing protein n=1 Tax=Altererythrobacter arenosus TaxID=3032592 RepID=A0ABY8FM16_9SPHN|nr:rhodanese-like domain-containing protein [Altererythrobacter sp. CAU 1644]WFL76063.1 rhodanese-like domain-containing protein [Altererythrobacter sp. CAU 1644]
MFHQTLLAAAIALASAALPAAEQETNPQIDYQGFLELTSELGEVRAQHRLPLAEFLARARADGAILLDTRSAAAFEAGHLEGAVNLPFSDFTDDKLAQVIGQDADRPIFIYCNNNFSDNVAPVTSKRAPLALNIPTFINLHGYGYTNVWELADVVAISQVPWVTGSPRG